MTTTMALLPLPQRLFQRNQPGESMEVDVDDSENDIPCIGTRVFNELICSCVVNAKMESCVDKIVNELHVQTKSLCVALCAREVKNAFA